jgi:phosphoribosylglycinamide formyltransferase-1
MTRVGVLVSGRGSNLQALIDAAREERLGGGEIVVVISNVETAFGLERARRAGIPAVYVDPRGRSREDYDRDTAAILHDHAVDLVCLAGYMRLLSPAFVEPFRGRILNIHPALLPAFKGLDAQHQAWEYGVKVSGATVHLVDEHLDSGPIIVQEAVPVNDSDSADDLAARILAVEHVLYPRAVRALLSKRYRIEGRRVVFEEPPG